MKRLEIQSLPKGWCDRSELLLHAMFQVLVDFVEKEKPFDYWEYEEHTEQRHAAEEIKSLYDWWKNRLNRISPFDEVPKEHIKFPLDKMSKEWRESSKKACEQEVLYILEDMENMLRLVKIHRHLWA